MTTQHNDNAAFLAASSSNNEQKATPSTWLLAQFNTGDLYYTSPTIQYRAEADSLVVRKHEVVSNQVIESLFAEAKSKNIKDSLLFGLVPFDAKQPASLTIPASYQQASVPKASPVLNKTEQEAPGIAKREPLPAPEQYGDAVRSALTLFEQGQVEKIVLSRAMDITLDAPLQQGPVLQDLIARNRHGYTFAIPAWKNTDAEGVQADGVMLGASPELLVRREGDRIFVNPLAGSIGRHEDPSVDQARRDGLAVSEKDLREHSYVVNDIVAILKQYCDELEVPEGPSVIGTDALWHLSTYITGRLRDTATTALELSCALHPTPAICGHPTEKAFNYIKELEAFDRNYFAGLVGWQKENGDGEWALTLRCAFHTPEENRLRVYAGAGTVAGSDPDSEILETATKMETFMRAIR